MSDLAATGYAQHVKVTKLPGGTTYRYVHIPPQEDSRPTILFLHGYPSTSYVWHRQIKFFSEKGYGVVAPDLLGYGGTDKPTQPEDYRMKRMADDVVQILDNENVKTVMGVGHDWGAVLLCRLANWHPSRFLCYTLLDVPYSPPGKSFNYDAVKEMNAMASKALGHSVFGYWFFFDEPDAGDVIDSHMESFESLVYPGDASLWKTHLGPEGAMKEWVTQDKKGPVAEWLSDEERSINHNIFASNGGYGPPLNWYRATLRGVDEADEKEIPKERISIDKPLLMLLGLRCPITMADFCEQSTRPYVRDLQIKHMDTGHWLQLEATDDTNRYLSEFFDGVLAKKSSL